MEDDPIVAEVRRARDAYAARFGYDLAAICRDLMERQQQSGRELVQPPPSQPASPDDSAAVVPQPGAAR
jgi:hypothetical protein